MRKWLVTFLLVLPVWAGASLPPEVRVGKLPGEVHTYVWPVSSNQPITVEMCIPVCYLHEAEGEAGVTSALAQLMRKGTSKFSEAAIDAFVGQLGGDRPLKIWSNDPTSASFCFEVPREKPELVSTALAILADWAWNWTPQAASIDTRFPTPIFLIPQKNLIGAAMGRKAGLEERSIPSMDTIETFYQKWYRSLPIAVTISGDVEPSLMEREIAQAFDTPPSGKRLPLAYPPITYSWFEQVTLKSNAGWMPFWASQDGDVEAEVTLLAPRKASFSNEGAIASDALARILARRMYDRLEQAYGYKQPIGWNQEDLHGNCAEYEFWFKCRLSEVAEVLRMFVDECEKVKSGEVTVLEVLLCGALENATSIAEIDTFIDWKPSFLATECQQHFLGASSMTRADLMYEACAKLNPALVQQAAGHLPPLSKAQVQIEVLTAGVSQQRIDEVVEDVKALLQDS